VNREKSRKRGNNGAQSAWIRAEWIRWAVRPVTRPLVGHRASLPRSEARSRLPVVGSGPADSSCSRDAWHTNLSQTSTYQHAHQMGLQESMRRFDASRSARSSRLQGRITWRKPSPISWRGYNRRANMRMESTPRRREMPRGSLAGVRRQGQSHGHRDIDSRWSSLGPCAVAGVV